MYVAVYRRRPLSRLASVTSQVVSVSESGQPPYRRHGIRPLPGPEEEETPSPIDSAFEVVVTDENLTSNMLRIKVCDSFPFPAMSAAKQANAFTGTDGFFIRLSRTVAMSVERGKLGKQFSRTLWFRWRCLMIELALVGRRWSWKQGTVGGGLRLFLGKSTRLEGIVDSFGFPDARARVSLMSLN